MPRLAPLASPLSPIPGSSERAGPPRFAGRVGRFLQLLALWRQRIRSRQRLACLTARELADVGLTPEDVARECDKPFWQGH